MHPHPPLRLPMYRNAFKCRFVALCPTMRTPASVTWHREIVYNCVWSLLVAIDEHNARAANEPEGGGRIETVVMTGLATGSRILRFLLRPHMRPARMASSTEL
ncbi:hypothetical protein L226DRAFT_161126 [Lentinus tigrinus ALCF2SS1-7]|uniref:Uncharacterized protein n=1 Tax=Lentinus tigrinus ALCF2SS1-6 TaxID=1328759 RepID=A0A5C2S7S0_9APHY|nr:hypothetical protein L227DRAFT_229979 [Lentinus tigrinus ALCF2SS1-6]RPD72055.1 hypothetical protein L226DRAFT_161126 [Lentinus tigrinus ALCF2SS1-7]